MRFSWCCNYVCNIKLDPNVSQTVYKLHFSSINHARFQFTSQNPKQTSKGLTLETPSIILHTESIHEARSRGMNCKHTHKNSLRRAHRYNSNLNMLKIVFLSKIDTNIYFNKKNKEDRYTRYAYIKCIYIYMRWEI